MFKNLKQVMALKSMSNNDLAEFLELTRKTVDNKISGTTEWTLSEILRVKKFLFPEYDVDWLFQYDADLKQTNKSA